VEILGVTLSPFKYDPGVVEKSMRMVKAVFKPGEVDKEQSRKCKGVDEDSGVGEATCEGGVESVE